MSRRATVSIDAHLCASTGPESAFGLRKGSIRAAKPDTLETAALEPLCTARRKLYVRASSVTVCIRAVEAICDSWDTSLRREPRSPEQQSASSDATPHHALVWPHRWRLGCRSTAASVDVQNRATVPTGLSPLRPPQHK